MPVTSLGWALLSLSQRKARYGVAYVRSICAQAGVKVTENSPDEDVLAVDCDVTFSEANVRVQVKCTSELTIRGRSASRPVKREWVRRWQESLLPVYFVIVIVPPESTDWLAHKPDGTFHRTAAFWRRILPDEVLGTTIKIPKTQRLEVSTLRQWHSDLMRALIPATDGKA